MTNDIELPPMPPYFFSGCRMTTEELRSYARAAIEADRRLRAVPGDMVPLSYSALEEIARKAHIAFCLEKASSFELAFARLIERAHGIAAAPTAAAPAGGAGGGQG